jgi:ferredoxin-NADP reductase
MPFNATILMTGFVTHDVKRFIISKPDNFAFRPGQGVELSINQPGLEESKRPFTPTCLTNARVLEFTIKGYPEHDGVTKRLHELEPGAELLLSEPFGTIEYKGPGTFIAGGAGITPFLSILRNEVRTRDLREHTLIFSNKTPEDIICEKELRHYFGNNFITVCTRARGPSCEQRRIDKAFLEQTIKSLDRHFYVCGPSSFTKTIKQALQEMGVQAESLVFER